MGPADDRLRELIDAWLEAFDAGADPSPADLCRDCPDLLPELERRVAVFRWMAEDPPAGRSPDSPLAPDPATRDWDPAASTAPPNGRLARPTAGWDAPPGYEIEGELGEGGMGIVYLARETALGRLTALKVVKSGWVVGPAERARLRDEARAVARLSHPHVIQIYKVGEHRGVPFLALEYCPGGGLDRKLAAALLPPREAAGLVATLARAVDAAHAAGIIHRDLKPQNVLLAADGTPRVADFGLVKWAEPGGDGASVTRTGIGTPSYMAPEQASGAKGWVDRRTDVYALGAVLYECLTGCPPFKGADLLDTLNQVRAADPVPPRALQPRVPRDLETVALKCLEKDPARRYPTAAALAADLDRFLAGEPVHARPVGPTGRVWRWCRRNPAVASASGASAALLAALLVALAAYAESQREYAETQKESATVQSGLRRRAEELLAAAVEEKARADREAHEARRQTAAAETAREASDRVAYAALTGQAYGEIRDGSPEQARVALAATRWDLRGWEYRYLTRRAQGGALTLWGDASPVRAVAWSPDDSALAAGWDSGRVRGWNPRTGAEVFVIPPPAPDARVRSVAFSRDGGRLAVAYHAGGVRVWDTRRGGECWSRAGIGNATAVAFNAAGTLLAVGSLDRGATLLDAATGADRQALAPVGDVRAVAFSPDGERVAAGYFTDGVRVWDARSGDARRHLWAGKRATGVAFDPAGGRLAAATSGLIQVWDAVGVEIASSQFPGPVSVAFSPDGGHVLAAAIDGHAVSFAARTMTETRRYRAGGMLSSAGYSPDGRRVAVGSHDGVVRVWATDPAADPSPHIRLDHGRFRNDFLPSVAFHPGGRWVAVASRNTGSLRVHDAATGRLRYEVPEDGGFFSVDFSPDGRWLAAANGGERVVVMDAATGENARKLGTGREVCFSPDGHRLAAAGAGIRTWDTATWAERVLVPPSGYRFASPNFHPDGTRLAAVEGEGRPTTVWDVRTGEARLRLPPASCVGFSPDGGRLVTGTNDGVLRAYDAATAAEHWVVRHGSQLNPLRFNPDGTRVVVAAGDGAVRLFSAATGAELLALRPPEAATSVAFSRDGELLAAGTRGSGGVWVWDARLTADEAA
ncbi:protein kinase, partial [bacterium]|nr:protein kinase [bacterium]